MEETFEIPVTVKVTHENKTVIKNLIKSLEAIQAIDENSVGLIVSAAECMDLI